MSFENLSEPENLTEPEYNLMEKYSIAFSAVKDADESKIVDVVFEFDDLPFSLRDKGFVVFKPFELRGMNTNHNVKGIYLTDKGIELVKAIHGFKQL